MLSSVLPMFSSKNFTVSGLTFRTLAHFLVYLCTETPLSFSILNSSAGISLPPLALLIVKLPKAHLTSHSRILGSR